MDWYPAGKKELNEILDKFLNLKDKLRITSKEISGIIIPHAGYEYSGQIAGKAYSLLKNKRNNLAVILAPSHYFPLREIAMHNQSAWQTPLGNIKIAKTRLDFTKIDISKEHALDNQMPFLQKLGFAEILPLLVGEISGEEAKKIAEELSKIKNAVFIISTDLSHFLSYDKAVKKDAQTIEAIENLDSEKLLGIENSACGIFPLIILVELCKIKKLKPKLLEYKNSGDITGDKSSVVGYASLFF